MDIFGFLKSNLVLFTDNPIVATLVLAFVFFIGTIVFQSLRDESLRFKSLPGKVLGSLAILAALPFGLIWIGFCAATGRDAHSNAGLLLNGRRRDNLKIAFWDEDPALDPVQPQLEELRTWAETDEWEKIHDVIRKADQTREFLPDGRSAAEVYSDVVLFEVLALEHASETFEHSISLEKLHQAVMPFHERSLAKKDDYITGALAAKAHLRAGWAARGQGWFNDIPEAYLQSFLEHMDAADRLCKIFPSQQHQSPLLAAIHYRLVSGTNCSGAEFRARFSIWQQLNPLDAAPYRSHGSFLLPRWFGSYEELEDCARYMMEQTKDQFGAAAYMLMYEGASYDEDTQTNMDVELFVEGAVDFAQFTGTQNAVNIALNALHSLQVDYLPDGERLAPIVNAAISELTSQDLLYILPDLWDELSPLNVKQLITRNWMDELKRDAQVLYTPKGVQVIEPSPT